MRTLALSLALLFLAGCATTGKSWTGDQADADRNHCYTTTKGQEPSVGMKIAVYASNILVIPISTALTLGFGTVYMTPKTGYQAQQAYFDQCMANLGYKPK